MTTGIGNTAYRIKNMRHAYDRRVVLDIPRLDIGKGSILGLTGPNGSGKSTLLRILAFLEEPVRGEVFFLGSRSPGGDRTQVTLLLQKTLLLKRTVFENIAYGPKLRNRRKDLAETVTGAMNAVGLEPDIFSHRKWYQLSGGEAQRVALAARIALRPAVLLLDEPTASVDSASAALIKAAVLAAREKWNTTLVISSHDLDWVYKAADDVLEIKEGLIHTPSKWWIPE